MAGGVRERALSDARASRRSGPRAWIALAALLAAGAWAVSSALGTPPASSSLDWQPGLGLVQPWRAWTAAWVHGSGPHLAGNLAATALVAWLGAEARVTGRDALAWALAWPLAQAGLAVVAPAGPAVDALSRPHWFGLSGVLHAGVVIVALSLCTHASREAARSWPRERIVGLALLVGTLAKVLAEAPWDPSPRPGGWLQIAVAPAMHASGVLAGGLAWAATAVVARLPARDARASTPPGT